MSYKRKVTKFIIEKYTELKDQFDKKHKKNIKKVKHGNKTLLRFEGNSKLAYELNILREIIEELELQ